MTTKNCNLFSRNNQRKLDFEIDGNSQYSNLNLNQSYKCSKTDLKNDSSSKEKEQARNHCSKSKTSLISYEKADKNLISKRSDGYFNLQHGCQSENNNLNKNCEMKGLNENRSTLSLHIVAYENAVDTDNYSFDDKTTNLKKANFGKTLKDVQKLFTLGSAVENTFEISRQQDKEERIPEVMEFKATQQLLKPDEHISTGYKMMPLTNSEMTYKEKLFYLIVDHIYLSTSTPTTYKQISVQWNFLGHDQSLENALKFLNYFSINDFIRQNQNYFDFLEIFVTDTKPENDNDKIELVLYYFNKNIQKSEVLSETMKEKLALDQKQFIQKRWRVSFHETKYFEVYNSLEFIYGRKSFARIVDICERERNVNKNGFVPIHKFQEVAQRMYDESFAVLLKVWFPKCSKLQNIMENIISDEVLCKFQGEGEQIQFRLYGGYPYHEIERYLDAFKNESARFFGKVYYQLGYGKDGKKFVKRPDQIQRIKYTRTKIPVANEPKSTVFGDSDSENDLRLENQAFFTPKEQRNDPKVVEKKVTEIQKVEEQEKKLYGMREFAEKYELCADNEITNFVREFENWCDLMNKEEIEEIEHCQQVSSPLIADRCPSATQKSSDLTRPTLTSSSHCDSETSKLEPEYVQNDVASTSVRIPDILDMSIPCDEGR